MKFTLSLLALPFLGALAAPTISFGKQLAAEAKAYSDLETLYSTVQKYTGEINSTVASIGSNSTAFTNATAASTFRHDLEAITIAVNAAKPELQAIVAGLSINKAVSNGTNEPIANLVSNIILDVNGAVDGILNTLGLGSIPNLLQPLTSSLSGLLTAVKGVVDNIISAVKQIVDGLLNGLSAASLGL